MTTLEKIYALKEAAKLIRLSLVDGYAMEDLLKRIDDAIAILQKKVSIG